MKLIINISDESYDKALNGIINCKECFDAIVYGTPIPDNATNGDVIKAMFPTGYERAHEPMMDFVVDGYCYEFGYDWWNAPYQKGGKTSCESCKHYGEDLHGANCRFCHEYSRYERR